MARTPPYLLHLKVSSDLVTTYEQVRAGFVALALERNRRATPYVEQARALKSHAAQARTPKDLLKMPEIRLALLAAAGVSDKAANHMEEEDKIEAISGLIGDFLDPAGPSFAEELVFRFLLTKGDALGGSMRNIGGALAQRKLIRAVVSTLALSKIPFHWLHGSNGAWISFDEDRDLDFDSCARGLSWKSDKGDRTLAFNMKAPIVKNNIDLSLLSCAYGDLKLANRNPSFFVALAELKGGIDPAGADEHWKTARTAISRVKAAFAAHQVSPRVFFVGAAIAKKMAQEIWTDLERGALDNAANLTDPDQIASLCRWLMSL